VTLLCRAGYTLGFATRHPLADLGAAVWTLDARLDSAEGRQQRVDGAPPVKTIS